MNGLTIALQVVALLVAFCLAARCGAGPSGTVSGQMLDRPCPFPDGSMRFHILPDEASDEGEWVEVPAGGDLDI